eukprot:583691-Rhodomonas_salina.1
MCIRDSPDTGSKRQKRDHDSDDPDHTPTCQSKRIRASNPAHAKKATIVTCAMAREEKSATTNSEPGRHSRAFPASGSREQYALADSGCTSHLTNVLGNLINVRKCKKQVKVANGEFVTASQCGDMPIKSRTEHGDYEAITFKNVLYSPDFDDTIFSVDWCRNWGHNIVFGAKVGLILNARNKSFDS